MDGGASEGRGENKKKKKGARKGTKRRIFLRKRRLGLLENGRAKGWVNGGEKGPTRS